MKRILRQIPVLLCLLTCGLFAFIVLQQITGQQTLAFAYQNRSLLSNAVLIVPVLGLTALLLWLRTRESKPAADSLWALRIGFVIVLGAQFLVARCCWAHLGWDPAMMHRTAEELARGEMISRPDYYVLCPNNAPLAVLQAVPLWAAVKLGIGVPYVVLHYIDAVLLNLSAYFCVRCVQLLTESRTARWFAIVVSIGWIAMSPYIVYPYTDVYSILFLVLALYVYLKWTEKPVWQWFVISLLCFAGAAIKPTVLIMLIALLLMKLFTFRPVPWKRFAALAVAIVIGAVPGKVFQDKSTEFLAGSSKPEKQLSVTHYLMLGMNTATYGGHSPEDVAFTESFETLSQRQSANIARAWERVQERGVWGNVEFFAVKLYKSYADGSFASHGSFQELELPKRSDGLSILLRSLYNKRGSLMPVCQTVAQGLWLGVLALCAVAAFLQRRNPSAALLCLTLLGLTAYLLLFEVWPRYLFLYAPFFVILSSLAFDEPICKK